MKRAIVLFTLVLLDGCIHTQTHSTARIAEKDARMTREAPAVEAVDDGALRVMAEIYKPARLPLDAFFEGLARGEFHEALRRFDVRYSASNTDGEALKILLENGFVPVLVNVANVGTEVEDTGRLRMRLRTPDGTIDAIPSADLPREFEALNWKALPANAYNIAVVVVVTAAILAVLVSARGGGGFSTGSGGRGKGGGPIIWNPLTKTTEIDYSSYLFKPSPLRPGEGRTGLVFFKAPKGFSDWGELRLEAGAAR